MSELEQMFAQAIKVTTKKKRRFTLAIGTVKSITGDLCTVDHYEDVRLNAVIDNLNSRFTIYPKLDSKVIIGMLENQSDAFVVKVSEIEKVTIMIGDQLFEMKDGKFTIKSAGISLKSVLNGFLTKLQTATILTQTGGTGTFSPADIAQFELYNNHINQLMQ